MSNASPLPSSPRRDPLPASPLLNRLLHRSTAADYTILWLLYRQTDQTGNHKRYLRDIADQLELPIGQVSKLVKDLQNKGLVHWTHDGSGQEGTYIQLTETAVRDGMAHREKLRQIMEAFGEEEFVHLLGELSRLDTVIRTTEEKEDPSLALPNH